MHPCLLPLLVAASLTLSCASTGEDGPAAPSHAVEGSVTYLERMGLPPSAVLHVALHDLGLDRGAAPRTLASAAIPMEGRGVPFPFRLPFDADDVVPGGTHVVTASIEAEGRVLFGTPAPVGALTGGAPAVLDLLLRRGGAAARPSLEGTHWRVTELDGRAVTVVAGQRSPWLRLDAAAGTYQGHGGVNLFHGRCTLDGQELRLQPGPMTRMAGEPAAMAREDALVGALAAADGWGIEGNELVLTASGRPVARLEAVRPD